MQVNVRDMRENEFQNLIKIGKPNYIEGLMRSFAVSKEKATEMADKEYKQILTDGIHTKDHYFFTAEGDGKFIGFAWFQVRDIGSKKTAWGYDLHVLDEYRRKGVAKQIFNQLEVPLKKLGVSDVRFHVFADNFKAIPLYEQFGFQTTNITMRKQLI